MRRRALVALPMLALAGIGAAPARADSSGAGCAPGRPAVAHHAGGVAVAQARVPIPCATETGYYTGETTLGVTAGGTVWFSAADWEWALVRTRDDGAHWERVVVPGPQAYPGCGIGTSGFTQCDDSEDAKYNTVADAFLYVDRDTSRVFWAKTYGYAICSSLDYTSDDGGSWKPVTRFGCPGGDYEKVASGPAPAGGAKPSGYPNVVYGCTNGPAPVFVAGPARVCFKSLDGGTTWNAAGVPPVPSPLAPGCLHFQESQFVARDGTVYLPLNCGPTSIMLAISHDEAQTWSYVSVPIGDAGNGKLVLGGVSGAVDDAGNVYVVWRGSDKRPYIAVSRDGGKTWTGPLMAGAPGVRVGDPPPQVAARQPGHVAIGYYGYTSAESRLSGYLTESFDAVSARPLFFSASLNDPAAPLYFPTTGKNPRNDYLGVAIARDGTPWAGLVKLRSPTPDSQGYVQSTGFAGRLVFPKPAAPRGCVDRRKFTFRLHHAPHQRVVRAMVYVNGSLRLSRRGRALRSVTLRRLPKGRFEVRVVATQSSGARLISTRVYRGCTKGRPRTHRGR